MTFDFESQAHKLCREHGLPDTVANIKVLVAAMEHGAFVVVDQTATNMKTWTDNFVAKREKNNGPN